MSETDVKASFDRLLCSYRSCGVDLRIYCRPRGSDIINGNRLKATMDVVYDRSVMVEIGALGGNSPGDEERE
jgi:hypothetical protein